MEKRTFQKCRYYRSGDVLFSDIGMSKRQGNNTEIIKTDMNNIYPIQSGDR